MVESDRFKEIITNVSNKIKDIANIGGYKLSYINHVIGNENIIYYNITTKILIGYLLSNGYVAKEGILTGEVIINW